MRERREDGEENREWRERKIPKGGTTHKKRKEEKEVWGIGDGSQKRRKA